MNIYMNKSKEEEQSYYWQNAVLLKVVFGLITTFDSNKSSDLLRYDGFSLLILLQFMKMI